MTDLSSRSPKRPVMAGAATLAVILVVALIVASVHLYLTSLPPHPALAQAKSASTSNRSTTSVSTIPPTVPTLPPTNLLSWRTVAFPTGFSTYNVFTDVAVAPSNANSAYACSVASLPQAIWVTHDQGFSWQIVGHLPTSQPGECYLVVDSTQSNVLVAADEYRPVGDASPMDVYSLDFASADGGLTWHNIGSNIGYGELATYQETTYALDVDLTLPPHASKAGDSHTLTSAVPGSSSRLTPRAVAPSAVVALSPGVR